MRERLPPFTMFSVAPRALSKTTLLALPMENVFQFMIPVAPDCSIVIRPPDFEIVPRPSVNRPLPGRGLAIVPPAEISSASVPAPLKKSVFKLAIIPSPLTTSHYSAKPACDHESLADVPDMFYNLFGKLRLLKRKTAESICGQGLVCAPQNLCGCPGRLRYLVP